MDTTTTTNAAEPKSSRRAAGRKALGGSAQARRQAAVMLEVLSGVKGPPEAGHQPKVADHQSDTHQRSHP